MPFEKVETQIDFPAQERIVLEFWNRSQAFEKLREQNRGKPRWSFLDGPITANNPMGVHHAWGRTYKDLYQRYFAMTGHELRYQNGFDCQGLWVEVEVEKEFKLQSKRDIENLVPGDRFASIDKFVQECKNRVDKFARIQTEQSIRLGYWMDWDRPEDWKKPADQRRSYFTMSEENNYTIWTFLKKCHERGLIYRGYDSMPWCPRCAVGLSQMEMHEGYVRVAHRALFVKFPLRAGSVSDGSKSPQPQTPVANASGSAECLLVWTTTPWTLTSNVAAAVNPSLTYLKVKHRDQIYYLAKGAFTAQRLEEEFKRKEWVEGAPKLKSLEQIFKEKGGYEIVGTLTGKEMIGWTYDGPFDELPAQSHPAGYPPEIAEVVLKQGWGPKESAKNIHRVIAWDAVGEVEGTGIVHIAPGCGKEDFFLGKSEKLVPIAPLNEEGVFIAGFGPLEGKSAIDHATTDMILDNLQQKGLLLAVEKYPHSYPHCWRCKTELLFRLVDEWFINMSWRDEIAQVVEKAKFLPESINGRARELDWLKNMGDWMISKKRFWGLALPIWVCDLCNHFDVIGNRDQLEERAIEGWEKFDGHTPHRPWIDLIKIECRKCGGIASRIADVGNPWLDAGIVGFSTLKYRTDHAHWEKWFPADFITESFPGQFRNWFYSLLAMSTMMLHRSEKEGTPPFKTLLGHGLVRDQWGEEMHKSKGNAIPFEGAADTGYTLKDKKTGKEQKHPPMSADLMRWMYARHDPAQNINFGPGPAEELRSKFTLKLWNTYAFFCNYARLDGFDPTVPQTPLKDRPDIDRWILSDLQLLIRKAREAYESFDVRAFCLETEKFVDDRLSNWYVRRNRRRFWKSEKTADKLAAYQTLYTVLLTLTKLCAPVMPFLADAVYQNLAQRGSRVSEGSPPESVHLSEFPEVDASLVDEPLSGDMDTLLNLVSLGSAARNLAKIKVRQPLAEMKVHGDDNDCRAIERFAQQIMEELNVKKVTIAERGSPQFFTVEPYLRRDTVKFQFGAKAGQVMAAFDQFPREEICKFANQNEPLNLVLASGENISLIPLEHFELMAKGLPGWSVVEQFGTIVGVDARITPELAQEGMAREIVRFVQQARKDGGLEMENRIVLYLHTESADLKKAIATHKDYIAAECLVAEWSDKALGEGAYGVDVKIDGQPLRIELRRI